MECVKCVCVRGGLGFVSERIGFVLYQSCGNRGSVGRVSVFRLQRCGWVAWARVWKSGVVLCLCVVVVSRYYVCRWRVQVLIYCARRIPVQLRCT